MNLDGIHHVTAITADGQRNVDFYAGTLGLRLVKTTVNFDAPDMYHLYFGDEAGSPGSIMTFFEIPGAGAGRPGPGMVHRVAWRVPSTGSLEYWEARLGDAGVATRREDGALRFADPEGLGIELVPDGPEEGERRRAHAHDVDPEHALAGIAGVRAYSRHPEETARVLGQLGFARDGGGAFATAGPERRGRYVLDDAPAERGVPGAGTVHHVAWTSLDADHEGWRRRVIETGGAPTGVIDRQYFRSIYFREPGHVLFEIATVSPGFAVDEEPEHLGEALRLPPRYEDLRDRIEERLRPLRNPRSRTWVPAGAGSAR